MDALKKAEEEKKQAAKRLQEVEIEARESTAEEPVENEQSAEEEDSVPELFTETAQFSLEPISLEEKEEKPKEDVIVENDNIPTTEGLTLEQAPSLSFSEDMTMENIVSEEVNTQEKFDETQKEVDLNDTTIIEGLSTEDASAPFDDTFHGVVFEDEPETDIYEETLPGVPADTLARDLGGGKFQPTPVAAKTVFSAGKQTKKKSPFKWGVFAVLALLAAGSFAVFYYFTITPVSRDLPSPLVARGIEFSGVESAPIEVPPVVKHEEVQPPASESIIEQSEIQVQEELINKEIVQQAIEEEKNEKQNLIAKFDEESIEKAPEMELIEGTPEQAPVAVEESVISEEVSEPEEVVTEVETPEVANTETVAREEAVKDSVQLDPSLIDISKSKKVNQENEMLSQAFKAYKDGHYDAAKSIYEGILKNDPDNRDVHLGLAAIAINKNDRKSAYSHYVHLLELNPLDTLAMSSLIALSNSADPLKDESAIKLLIQRDDDIPHLYFILGNLYAKQERWADAQQAFFDAYRLDTTNSDYVLNLAVSLDQMGQYSSALDYYKSAIELSVDSSTNFNTAIVNKRITALSKLIN